MKKIIIESKTKDGKQFRPSDWIDRMSSGFAKFTTNKKLVYSEYLKPVIYNENRCLEIGIEFKEKYPDAYNEIIEFIEQNNLSVIELN